MTLPSTTGTEDWKDWISTNFLTASLLAQLVKCLDTDELVTATADIIWEARKYYQTLYSVDDILEDDIEALLTNVPSNAVLNSSQQEMLDADPTESEIMSVVDDTPSGKSPGLDSIPFEVYHYIFTTFYSARTLFSRVLKDTFTTRSYPTSWEQPRMVLLFKKGDPTLLSN
ncbi:hypothetical protein BD770DRAFT_84952 [Pilaira anomala]|nr:hypothetical protein BD770DRAFT_84952 [Pilaira anomala]